MSKKTFRCTSIIVFVLLCSVGGIYWLATNFINNYDAITDCNPKKLMRHIEHQYGCVFSKEISNVRAAQGGAGFADSGFEYILKFAASPNLVQEFLNLLPKDPDESFLFKNLRQYNSQDDERLNYTENMPEWSRTPITKGYMVYVHAKSPGADSLRIYIDTHDTNEYTVYLRGRNMF